MLLYHQACVKTDSTNPYKGAPFLKARDLDTVLNTTHHSSLDVDLSTDPNVLFASNATCILGSDVTQGPYCACPPPTPLNNPTLT